MTVWVEPEGMLRVAAIAAPMDVPGAEDELPLHSMWSNVLCCDSKILTKLDENIALV